MKIWILWVLTVTTFFVMVFGFFHIPILGACGVMFPERNFLWGLSIIPIVVVSAIPFCICVYFLIKKIKEKRDDKKDKK